MPRRKGSKKPDSNSASDKMNVAPAPGPSKVVDAARSSNPFAVLADTSPTTEDQGRILNIKKSYLFV